MLEPSLRDFSPIEVKASSWSTRVRENLRQLLTNMSLTPTSANGAPIHLLKLERSGRARSSQTVSLLTHLGILAALLFAATIASPPRKADRALGGVPIGPLFYSAARAERLGDEA